MAELIHDKTTSKGMQNVLKRGKQLSELRWTPVLPLPGIVSEAQSGSKPHVFFQAWRPQKGVNYSAVRFDEKYVGSNVSLYTYLTAMSNPRSVLYTRPLLGRSILASAFYGAVCSQFVSYAFDLPFQIDCQQWPYLPGIHEVDPKPLENLKVCDVLNCATKHTAFISDIVRTTDGKIAAITVSEATPPHVIATEFTAEEFSAYWLAKGEYQVFRFENLDWVTYTPNACIHLDDDPELPEVRINRTLMPDYGDKANYMLGEKVTFEVYDSEAKEVVIERGGTKLHTLPVAGHRAEYLPSEAGYYMAKADGREEGVSFCVTDAEVSLGKTVFAPQEAIVPTFRCASEDDKLVGWVVKTNEFAKYWGYPIGHDGIIPKEAKLPAGKYLIISQYRNEYGTYCSKPCFFDVES